MKIYIRAKSKKSLNERIAKREGVTPFELQAIVWCAIKNEWEK